MPATSQPRPADDGSILLPDGFSEPWDPPVRLAFTDDQLRHYLLSMGNDGRDVFGDVDAVQGAYQLFLVHLDEELASAAMAGSRITMGPNGLDVDPVREREPWPDLDPDGDHAWVADPPDGGDQRLEFMSPEQYGARYRAHSVVTQTCPGSGPGRLTWSERIFMLVVPIRCRACS